MVRMRWQRLVISSRGTLGPETLFILRSDGTVARPGDGLDDLPAFQEDEEADLEESRDDAAREVP